MLLYNWHSPLCFRVRSLLSIQGCFQLRTAGCLQLQFRYILGSKNGNYRCFEEYQWCNPDPRTSRCSVSMWLWHTSTFFLHPVLLQFQTENDPLSSSLAACLTQPEIHGDSLKVEKDTSGISHSDVLLICFSPNQLQSTSAFAPEIASNPFKT